MMASLLLASGCSRQRDLAAPLLDENRIKEEFFVTREHFLAPPMPLDDHYLVFIGFKDELTPERRLAAWTELRQVMLDHILSDARQQSSEALPTHLFRDWSRNADITHPERAAGVVKPNDLVDLELQIATHRMQIEIAKGHALEQVYRTLIEKSR